MAMKISFTTLACPAWDLETIISRGSEYGYDAVDFRGLGEEMRVYRLPAFGAQAEQTRRRLADAGLAVSAFSSGARMFSVDQAERAGHLDEVARYAELCGTFGVDYIRVFGGKLKGTAVQEAVKISIEALEKMAAAARPRWIAVETHDDWINTAMLAGVLERVQAENVGVLWDLHHPFRMGGESPAQSYRNIGRYVCCTHVKDSKPTDDEGYVPVLPGEGGDVPLREMVSLLKAGGYDGYLTLEWEKRWHPEIAEPEEALPAYAKFLRELAETQPTTPSPAEA